jgi:surface carbohydrate biosynthesis protein
LKKVDFLFIYEVKSRELENICLLRYELESRGYTVEFLNTWYYFKYRLPPKIEAKVIVSFALYNDSTFKFLTSYTKSIPKIINMQWEQVGTVSDETSEKSNFLVKGIAREVVHICWGEKIIERLQDCYGISERKLMLAGHITHDFLREDFAGYYLSRSELFKKYSIPIDKRCCLFISSFSYVGLPEEIANVMTDVGYDFKEFIQISKKSQEEIIKWIYNKIQEDKDMIFIYRPHPAEAENQSLIELSKQNKNFYLISELSVKQWILTCDDLYTWYSTALAEIYASGKTCHILRPFQIPEDTELVICQGAKFVTSYDEFNSTFEEKDSPFPLNEDLLAKYYLIDKSRPAYQKICDAFIEVYNNDFYMLPELNNSQRVPRISKVRTYINRTFIGKILTCISLKLTFGIPFLKKQRERELSGNNAYIKNKALQNNASIDEIQEIVDKIRKTIDDNKKNNSIRRDMQ